MNLRPTKVSRVASSALHSLNSTKEGISLKTESLSTMIENVCVQVGVLCVCVLGLYVLVILPIRQTNAVGSFALQKTEQRTLTQGIILFLVSLNSL